MKKSIAFVLAIFMVVAAFSNNGTKPNFGGDDPKPVIVQSFRQNFKEATNVVWSVGQSYVTARFILNNSGLVAYFTPDGELMGMARSVIFSNLPVVPMKAILNRFPNAAPYEVVEYNVDLTTSYVMTIETAKKQLRVLVTPAGEISIMKKAAH